VLAKRLCEIWQLSAAATALSPSRLPSQERDGAEAFVDVLHEHLTRWQQHCGVGFPAHGASAAAAVADAQPRASTAGDGASMPARPSDSSSSLASPEAAAAYDKELKVLTVRLLGIRCCRSHAAKSKRSLCH